MPRKPIIGAALASGVAISMSHAHEGDWLTPADHAQPDAIELVSDFADGDAASLLYPDADTFDHVDVGMDRLIDPDDVGIDYAQTWGGGVGNDGLIDGLRRRGDGLETTPRPPRPDVPRVEPRRLRTDESPTAGDRKRRRKPDDRKRPRRTKK